MKFSYNILIAILWLTNMTDIAKADFLAIGHRGCRDLRPENTLAGIEYALGLGVDGVEIDIHLTRDGKLVVHHDYFLNQDLTRYTNGSWIESEKIPLSQMLFKDLQSFKLGQIKPNTPYAQLHPLILNTTDEPLPLLEDVFSLAKKYPNARLFIEVKTSPEEPMTASDPDKIATALTQAIAHSGMKDRCFVLAFEAIVLQKMKQLDPDLNLNLNYMHRSENHSPWHSDFVEENYESIPKWVHATGASGWSSDYELLTKKNIQEAHNLGLNVYAWTVNSTTHMEQLIKWGVDGIISDRPDLLMQFKK